MKQIQKAIILITLLAIPFSGFSQSAFRLFARTLTVLNIVEMSSREVEDLGEFYIEGTVTGAVNLGFTNTTVIVDERNHASRVYVTSDRRSLPAGKGEKVRLKVRLVREFKVGSLRGLLMKEVE